MRTIISYDLLAMTIIEIKKCVLGIDYATMDEFYYINQQLQKEFNKENNNTIIYSDFGKFDPDDIKVDNNILKIASDPLTKYVSTSKLSDYAYIILELIMEYAEKNLEEQKEKFEEFKGENNSFHEKQKNLIKRLSSN